MSAELAVINQVKNQTVRVPKTIVNKCSAGNVNLAFASTVLVQNSTSGAMTANVLKTLLSITGPGRLDVAAVSTADSTSRTLRMKITLDGTVAFDATSNALSGTDIGIIGAGFINAAGTDMVWEHACFNTSCLVEIASSLSETDKAKTYLKYQTY